MSVLLDTSLGDLVVDLDTERCPRTSKNFLKLCKAYKYNYLTFFSVQKGFLAQTGDPTNTGKGGQSIWSLLPRDAPEYTEEHYFSPERHNDVKHMARGTLSMACRRLDPADEESLVAGSQFFITLGDDLDYLDGKHAPFGRVVEGLEQGGPLDKINNAFVNDRDKRPLRDIRIKGTAVLFDPFEDLSGLAVSSRTPSPTPDQLKPIGLDASLALEDTEDTRTQEEIEEEERKRNFKTNALTLEMTGALPFAEIRPPENILFVCKLNPVTRSEDLELIFSRFGKILSCEVIKDKKTGDSLQYAFIEFDEKEAAERAWSKMQNVLVDDRRILVDFSQSVSKLSSSWNQSRSGGKPLRVTGNSNGRATGVSSSNGLYHAARYDERGSDRGSRSHDADHRRDRDRRYNDDRRYEHRRNDKSRSDDRREDPRHRGEGRRDEREHSGWRHRNGHVGMRDERRYDADHGRRDGRDNYRRSRDERSRSPRRDVDRRSRM